jgi:N-acetylglucosaminyldiphosphoundecaprenol N-acetyl-beta-D-mannosaminyltransferase
MKRSRVRNIDEGVRRSKTAEPQYTPASQSSHPDDLLRLDPPSVQIGKALIHAVTETQCVDLILRKLKATRGGWVVTMNLDYLRLFSRELWFANLCVQADLVVADGMPLVWVSYLQGTPLPERVTGSNLITSLTAAAAKQGRSIFLIGGKPGTAEASASLLQRRYPTLQVTGVCCPKAGFEKDPQVLVQLITTVHKAKPDIVYVGLGKPKQDLLITQLRQKYPQAWYLGVGISFSFLCGDVSRAPLWMQRIGLEWLHRLCQEPQRLAVRYLLHGIPFALMLLGSAAINRRCRTPHVSSDRLKNGASYISQTKFPS